MNTEFKSFSWDKAQFNRCTDEIRDWPAVLQLDGAHVPPPDTKGVVTEWVNSSAWPECDPGAGPGLVGNCLIVAKINGEWRVATYDWLRYPDQDEKSESLTSIRLEQINEEPWLSWRPQVGEVVGLLVATPCRNSFRTEDDSKLVPTDRTDITYATTFPAATITKIILVQIMLAVMGKS